MRTNKIVGISIVAIISLTISFVVLSIDEEIEEPDYGNTAELLNDVHIGVIFPLTGDLKTHGRENLESTLLAIDDFNTHLKTQNKTWALKPIIEDSATNPLVAREKVNRLYMEGIDIIIGLESSENIKKILPYTDSPDKLLFSCCSSSPSLAKEDNLFRLVPDDSNQGEVLAKLLQNQEIEIIVPLWRDNIWGNDLHKHTIESFLSLGGQVDDGIIYDPKSPESVNMTKLNEKVSKYIQKPGDENKIAILFLGFGEISNIMKSAGKIENNNLDDLTWFGPGSITKERGITNNDESFEFSQKINLTTVQVTNPDNNYHKQIRERLTEQFGDDPNSFVYSSYDMVWILGEAMLQADSPEAYKIKLELDRVLEEYNYKGTLGPITLNNNGDLKQADYDIWGLRDGQWVKLGTYTKTTDSILMN